MPNIKHKMEPVSQKKSGGSIAETTLDACKTLIRMPSITPDDAGCQEWLQEQLTAIGFHCESIDKGDTKNLYAEYGTSGPCFLFLGHTDVVPPGNADDWEHPPFAGAEDDSNIYGRGCVDMKGAIASMLAACKEFINTHKNNSKDANENNNKTPINYKIAWLITSDEEASGKYGTSYALEELKKRNFNPNLCLVGEPTSQSTTGDTIKIGRRGSLNAKIQIKGKQGHIAYPDQCDNPIERSSKIITELCQLSWPQNYPDFPPSKLQISNVAAGIGTTNVTPNHVEITMNIRHQPLSDIKSLKQPVIDIIERHASSYTVTWDHSAKSYYSPTLNAKSWPLANIIDSIKTINGAKTQLSTNGGTSDGRFVSTFNCPVFEIGLPQTSAHAINEWVGKKDLLDLSAIYLSILNIIDANLLKTDIYRPK